MTRHVARYPWLLAIALLSVPRPALLAQAANVAVTDPRIGALVAPLIGKDAPGLALIVAHRGRVIHRSGSGKANIGANIAFTTSTPSYIASVAKMFTALGILRLVDAGKLSLDTPVGTVLATAPAYLRAVTMRQLLTHTGGVIDHFDVGGEDRSYTTADVMQILREADSLRFAPGTRNSYSNSGYVLLAQVIEQVSGVSYAAFLQREFFTPFGMTSTSVADGRSPLPDNRALGYRKGTAGWELDDYRSSTTGAGGIYASVEDLHRFWVAMREGKVVTAASMETARTMQLLSNGKGTPFGMGWLAESDGRGPLKDKLYVAAVGQLRGFWSLLKWYYQDDLVVIWTANAAENTLFDALRVIPEIVLAP